MPRRSRDSDGSRTTLAWSGLLFSLLPLAGEIAVWSSFQGFVLILAQENTWPGSDQYGARAVMLAPMLVAYLVVCRLNHSHPQASQRPESPMQRRPSG